MPTNLKNQQELITFGIICHNAEKTVSRAIDSCLKQTWQNTEIIILDDFSQDQSRDILESYAQKHHNIHLILNEENKGVAFNRQKILETANGSYLAFLDDDDWALPCRLERQRDRIKNFLERKPDSIAFCYGDRLQIFEDGKKELVHGIGRDGHAPSGGPIADFLLARKRTSYHSWGSMGAGTMMAHTIKLKQLGGFDPEFKRAAEIDLALRCSLRDDIYFISVPDLVIHQYITHSPEKTFSKRRYYELKLAKKHWKLIFKRNLFLAVAKRYARIVKKILSEKLS